MDLKTRNSNKKTKNAGNSNQTNRKCNQKDVKTRNCYKKAENGCDYIENLQN